MDILFISCGQNEGRTNKWFEERKGGRIKGNEEHQMDQKEIRKEVKKED